MNSLFVTMRIVNLDPALKILEASRQAIYLHTKYRELPKCISATPGPCKADLDHLSIMAPKTICVKNEIIQLERRIEAVTMWPPKVCTGVLATKRSFRILRPKTRSKFLRKVQSSRTLFSKDKFQSYFDVEYLRLVIVCAILINSRALFRCSLVILVCCVPLVYHISLYADKIIVSRYEIGDEYYIIIIREAKCALQQDPPYRQWCRHRYASRIVTSVLLECVHSLPELSTQQNPNVDFRYSVRSETT